MGGLRARALGRESLWPELETIRYGVAYRSRRWEMPRGVFAGESLWGSLGAVSASISDFETLGGRNRYIPSFAHGCMFTNITNHGASYGEDAVRTTAWELFLRLCVGSGYRGHRIQDIFKIKALGFRGLQSSSILLGISRHRS